MSDLFAAGTERAGTCFTDEAFLADMVAVEQAWLTILVESGVAPSAADTVLANLVSAQDVSVLSAAAEGEGNPVPALVRLLRGRAHDDTSRWLHRGLTSQDVVDTALMMQLREALARVTGALTHQVETLVDLTTRHRDTPALARTLTQPALPTTLGSKTAQWLSAVLDAADALATVPPLPVQAGGAAGTLAATTELTGSAAVTLEMVENLALAVGLAPAAPWHTTRSVVTRAGGALITCCDAWGHVANDVATGSRAEVGEFAEGAGGGSSTMPHKANPVLAVLIRSAALTAPSLGAALHAASAASVDERSDGGWHAEWSTLRTLARQTVVAGTQTADLLAGLRVDTSRTAANLAAADGVLSEQRTMADLTGHTPRSAYLGTTATFVDDALQRARRFLKETR